jgi:hypothetical protein
MQTQCVLCKEETELLHINEILDFKDDVTQEILNFN